MYSPPKTRMDIARRAVKLSENDSRLGLGLIAVNSAPESDQRGGKRDALSVAFLEKT